jgi:hypothetical protein
MINNHQDLWHPHLKRKWLDDKNYVIYDNQKKIYATSLIQLKADSAFLENNTKPKLQCGCRFIKQDIMKSPYPAMASSFIELKANANSSN